MSLHGDVNSALVEIEPSMTYQGEGVEALLEASDLHFASGIKYLINEDGISPDATPPVVEQAADINAKKGAFGNGVKGGGGALKELIISPSVPSAGCCFVQ
jgi:hypothetical protein